MKKDWINNPVFYAKTLCRAARCFFCFLEKQRELVYFRRKGKRRKNDRRERIHMKKNLAVLAAAMLLLAACVAGAEGEFV